MRSMLDFPGNSHVDSRPAVRESADAVFADSQTLYLVFGFNIMVKQVQIHINPYQLLRGVRGCADGAPELLALYSFFVV